MRDALPEAGAEVLPVGVAEPWSSPPEGYAVGDAREEADLEVDVEADTEVLPDGDRGGEALPEAEPEGSGLTYCEPDALAERSAPSEAGAEGLTVGVAEP